MYKSLSVISILFVFLTTCIDPYPLHLSDYESLLVVEGMVTDCDTSSIILSRTFRDKNTEPEKVTGASIEVSGDDGTSVRFSETQPGVYIADPAHFRGIPGTTYTLHIHNGTDEYISDPVLMLPTPDIDTVTFAKDREFINNGTEEAQGIRIYVTSTTYDKNTTYLRWTYEETWKIKSAYPVAYKYLGHGSIISIPVENYICWKEDNSSDIIIHSIPPGAGQRTITRPLTFVDTKNSDRISVRYHILVKQYAIPEQAYLFWKNLKQVSEERGDIFDKQPFFVSGNIHSLTRKQEKILGLFQASSVKEKKRYITRTDILNLDLPLYRSKCKVVEIGPVDFKSPDLPGAQVPTFDELYNSYTAMGYVFVYPLYNGIYLERLAFATVSCSDCSITANPEKPDFWSDFP